ncbi:hypothetical protein DVH24_026817 [Malus domestica]|uniref:Integral membrane bound transporter domain-containing protein n=1 Tax=Malus domestica TaxID=3750 RepID=A0A498K4R1_MALDO|nr:hypothetical protein DVH24_026817 [Malus domestica]
MVPATRMGWTYAVWCLRLQAAFRTILACTIVYTTTLYGPQPLRRLVAYPAYSYLTTILIVSDATLGEALRGFWHALYACIQVLILSILSLQLIGPAHFSYFVSSLAVALCAFVVALPGATHLMSKRIAFGQIVIVYVGTAIHCAEVDELVLMHPIQVSLSTMLGASASVGAMLFPNLFLYQKASLAAVLSPYLAYDEAKPLAEAGEKLLRRIEHKQVKLPSVQEFGSSARVFAAYIVILTNVVYFGQEALLWERPTIRSILNRSRFSVREKLQEVEIPLRGIAIAATSCPSFPVAMIKKLQMDALHDMKRQIHDKLEQLERFAPFYTRNKRERSLDEAFWSLETIFPEDLLVFFFIDCLKILQENTEAVEECKHECSRIESSRGSQNQSNCCTKWSSRLLCLIPSRTSLRFALKCSLSLGLAVQLGLLFNKREAYWAGLTIAISFVRGRQATFTLANARAQSTAMGSIYGILCCFIFKKVEDLRFLPLLPWLVFTSFLWHSRMYGQAGGISAAVGALLILGRKHYGPPLDFAIARITEAVIGLISFITIEILTSPARAATLAKLKLLLGLGSLQECIKDLVLFENQITLVGPKLRQKQYKLKSHVNKLEKFIEEAQLEPNFWFIPFNGACYGKLLRSLSNTGNLSIIMSNIIESLSLVLQRFKPDSEELQKPMKGIEKDLEIFKKKIGNSLQCLQELASKKSLAVHDKHDIESGTLSARENGSRVLDSEKEETECIVDSFLQNSNELSDKIGTMTGLIEDHQKLRVQVTVCLGGLGFCISSLLREVKEMEREFQELIKLEDPSSHVIV